VDCCHPGKFYAFLPHATSVSQGLSSPDRAPALRIVEDVHDWAIVAAAGVGALIAGAFTLIDFGVRLRAEKERASLERDLQAHQSLVDASAEYLDAVERFMRATFNTPPLLVTDPERWVKTANFRLVAGQLARAVLMSLGKSGELPVTSEEAGEMFSIDDRLYAAAARLRLLAPKEVLQVIDEVEDPVRRWQKTPSFDVAKEWPTGLRQKVIETLQTACAR
jgi:hypothetical protein